MMLNDVETVPSSGDRQTYVVQDGDTLESISEMFYGVAHLWPRIMQANKCHRCRNGVAAGRMLVIPR